VLVAGSDILKGPPYARVIERGVPGSRYVEIPGSGHAVVVERPDAVAYSLLGFLDPLRGPAR
jgi:pimeloyl-ACP methyl ester carboxylesterase